MSVTTGKRRSSWIRETWNSSVGKKYVVAITGAILVGYVVLHMIGNLNTFAGPGDGDARIDRYAHWIREFGQPLLPYEFIVWALRVVLLGAFVLHIYTVFQLRAGSRRARGPYPARRIGRSFSSATMIVTGSLLLFFIVFHILQFTTLTIDVTPLQEGAVYANLYEAFQKWYFVVLYVLGVGALGFHLQHAVWSMFQSLGLDRADRNKGLRRLSTTLAVVISLGFVAVPISIITGVLSEPTTEQAAAPANPEGSA